MLLSTLGQHTPYSLDCCSVAADGCVREVSTFFIAPSHVHGDRSIACVVTSFQWCRGPIVTVYHSHLHDGGGFGTLWQSDFYITESNYLRTSACIVSDPCQWHNATGMGPNDTMQVELTCLLATSTKRRIRCMTFARSQRMVDRQDLLRLVFDHRIAMSICRSRLTKLTFVELGGLCLVLLGSSSCVGETESLAGNLSPADCISEDYVTVRLQKISFQKIWLATVSWNEGSHIFWNSKFEFPRRLGLSWSTSMLAFAKLSQPDSRWTPRTNTIPSHLCFYSTAVTLQARVVC